MRKPCRRERTSVPLACDLPVRLDGQCFRTAGHSSSMTSSRNRATLDDTERYLTAEKPRRGINRRCCRRYWEEGA